MVWVTPFLNSCRPLISADRQGEQVGLVVVALDTSGSMSPADLAAACAEIRSLAVNVGDLRLVVADAKVSLSISGGGDVLEPHDGVLAIGSGSPYALAAARALMSVGGDDGASLSAREICERSMRIAADACIYTNDNFTIEEMKTEEVDGAGATATTAATATEGSKGATTKKEKK